MTAKQTWIVEMPETWSPGKCDKCPMTECGLPDDVACPLADNAKKAVEVKSVYLDQEGVPVTLYATKENTK